ncbi:MAG: oxidoreductase, partial [Wenzhouxiangella sp.]
MFIHSIPLLAPAILLAVAVAAFLSPGRRPAPLPKLAEAAALGAFGVAILSAMLLLRFGPGGGEVAGLVTRLDLVSVIMLLLVSFVGWIVLRYAATYMDGEDRQGAFTG